MLYDIFIMIAEYLALLVFAIFIFALYYTSYFAYADWKKEIARKGKADNFTLYGAIVVFLMATSGFFIWLAAVSKLMGV